MITTYQIKRIAKQWASPLLLDGARKLTDIVKGNVNTNNQEGLIGLSLAAAGVYYCMLKWRSEEKQTQMIEQIIDGDCGLAADHLEDANYTPMPPPGEEVAELVLTRGVGVLNTKPVEINGHRKVRKGRGMKYMNCVLAETKAKFGTPSNDESNRRAVSRFVQNIMNKHGLRPTHIKTYLPMVVSLTFIAGKEETEALSVMNSAECLERKVNHLTQRLLGGIVPGC